MDDFPGGHIAVGIILVDFPARFVLGGVIRIKTDRHFPREQGFIALISEAFGDRIGAPSFGKEYREKWYFSPMSSFTSRSREIRKGYNAILNIVGTRGGRRLEVAVQHVWRPPTESQNRPPDSPRIEADDASPSVSPNSGRKL
jgi:hypothetical protein